MVERHRFGTMTRRTLALIATIGLSSACNSSTPIPAAPSPALPSYTPPVSLALTVLTVTMDVSPSSVAVNEPATFKATASALSAVNATLDFGDGSPVVVVAKRVDGGRGVYSAVFVTQRPYAMPGMFTAVLTASDAGGETASVVKSVVVR